MAFAGHCGLDVELTGWGENTLSALFSEELGAVVQIRAGDREAFLALLEEHELDDRSHHRRQSAPAHARQAVVERRCDRALALVRADARVARDQP